MEQQLKDAVALLEQVVAAQKAANDAGTIHDEASPHKALSKKWDAVTPEALKVSASKIVYEKADFATELDSLKKAVSASK